MIKSESLKTERKGKIVKIATFNKTRTLSLRLIKHFINHGYFYYFKKYYFIQETRFPKCLRLLHQNIDADMFYNHVVLQCFPASGVLDFITYLVTLLLLLLLLLFVLLLLVYWSIKLKDSLLYKTLFVCH